MRNGYYYTKKTESCTAVAKSVFTKKRSLGVEVNDERLLYLENCSLRFTNMDFKKSTKSFETCYWRRIEKINWTEPMRRLKKRKRINTDFFRLRKLTGLDKCLEEIAYYTVSSAETGGNSTSLGRRRRIHLIEI